MRVLTVVIRSSIMAIPSVETPSASSDSMMLNPAESSPTTPKRWLVIPIDFNPRATCAAAPTSSSLDVSLSTGTGALELRLFAYPWI